MKNTRTEPLKIYNRAYQAYLYLYRHQFLMRNKYLTTIYYFSRSLKRGALDALPEGYEVVESPISKMFFLRKKGAKSKKHVKVITHETKNRNDSEV